MVPISDIGHNKCWNWILNCNAVAEGLVKVVFGFKQPDLDMNVTQFSVFSLLFEE